MSDQPALPDRVCKNGHHVSVAERTGKVVKSRGRFILMCMECPREYQASMRALGLRR